MNGYLINMQQNAYQKILEKTFDLKIPFNAHLELTYKCNLSCVHCYVTNPLTLPSPPRGEDKGEGPSPPRGEDIRNELNPLTLPSPPRGEDKKDELTTLEIENVFKQLAEMGCLFITLTGGEIFCRNDLMALIKSARSKGFAVRLLTNGTLITREIADELAKLELLSVEISLYAMNPAIHDTITRTQGSHGKTMSAIKLCKERKVPVAIKSPLLKYNISEYEALRIFSEDIGARFVIDFLLIPTDNGSHPMWEHGASEQQLFEFFIANAKPGVELPAGPAPSTVVCGAGSNAVCISPIGDVFPCLTVRQAAGNIRNSSLKEIWVNPSLDKLRNLRYCALNDCRNCEYLAYCSRCSGVALQECGNIAGKSESACVIAKTRKRAMETLMASKFSVKSVSQM